MLISDGTATGQNMGENGVKQEMHYAIFYLRRRVQL